MTTILFMFFRDPSTGEPAFSASDAPTGGLGWRPLLLTGVGA